MCKDKLTEAQKKLLAEASQYTGANNPIRYDTLKSLCTNCKSFGNTFEALLWRGYFKPVKTNDYSNQFILVKL